MSEDTKLQKFIVTEGGSIKHDGKRYVEGDTLEAAPERVERLVATGAICNETTYKKGVMAAEKKARAKKGKEVRSGKDVPTSPDEGKLDEDGNTKILK